MSTQITVNELNMISVLFGHYKEELTQNHINLALENIPQPSKGYFYVGDVADYINNLKE